MALTAFTFSNFINNGYSPYWFNAGASESRKLNFSLLFYCRYGYYDLLDQYAGTFKIKPSPTGEILFNPQKVYSAYLNSYCLPTVTGWTAMPNSSLKIQMTMAEEYDNTTAGNTPTGVTQYAFSTSTSIMYAVNSYEEPEYGYQLSGICDTSLSLTYHSLQTDWVAANYYPIRRTEWMSMSYFQWFTNSSNRWNVKTYDVNNSLLAHYQFPITLTSSTWAKSYQLPSGTNNLSQTGTNILSGTVQTIITNSVHYYKVYGSVFGTPDVRKTIEYNYRIIDECDRYDLIRVGWLNHHWGGYDYWTFPLKSRLTIDRKNNEWEKFRDAHWVAGDRTRTNLNIELNRKINITSDWLTQNEADYVSNLFTSPDIFIIKDSGLKLPVQMLDNSSEVKTKDNDRIISYSFTLEYTYGISSQTT